MQSFHCIIRGFLAAVIILPWIVQATPATERPGLLFFTGDNPELNMPEATPGTPFTVIDHQGAQVASGQTGAAGAVIIEQLGPGFYTVKAAGTPDKNFSVIISPKQRQVAPNSPFAADVAASMMESVLAIAPGDYTKSYGYFADICRNAGIVNVRERISWGMIEPEKGKFNLAMFQTLGNAYAQRGIRVSATWHDIPAWSAAADQPPDNMFDLYNFAKQLSGSFAGKIDTWEFWNEQDAATFFKNTPSWRFAVMAKAAYLGLKTGNPDCTVMSGAFCLTPGGFWLNLVKNGYLDYIDVFNFHTYSPPDAYQQEMTMLKRTLTAANAPNLPIVITENNVKIYADGNTQFLGKPKKVQTPAQEMLAAEYNIKGQIELHAFGADRVYTFVLPPYNEDGLDWSLVRYDYTAKPALTAFANLTDMLGDTRYLGEVTLPGKNLHGYLFQKPDQTNVLVCWSDDIDKLVRWAADDHATIVDMFGKRTPAKLTGDVAEFTVGRRPVYLQRAKAPNNYKTLPRQSVAGPGNLAADKTVVLDLLPGKEFTVTSSRLALELPAKASDRSLTLRIINFSDQDKTVKLTTTAPLPGLPGEFAVKAWGTTERTITLPEHADEFYTATQINGTADGKPISPLAFAVIRHDAALPEGKEIAAMLKPENWQAKSSGQMTITYDAKRRALRFECEFAPNCNDRWAYPIFELKKAGVSAKNCLGMVFDITTEQTRAEVPPINNLVILNGDFIYYTPSAGEPVRNFIVFPSPDSLQTIAIGMNPTKNRIVWYLSRVRFIPNSETK